MNSSAISISLCGCGCQHQFCISGSHGSRTSYPQVPFRACFRSDIKPNRWHAGGHGAYMLSIEGHPLSGVPKFVFPRKLLAHASVRSNELFIVKQNVAGVESEPVCEEENEMIQQEMEDTDLDQPEHNLLPWRKLPIQQHLNFEAGGSSEPPTVSKRLVTGDDFRPYFLEERDEKVLSERILRLSRSNKIRSALELYWSMEYSGLRPTLHACNSLISCLLRNGMLDDALVIFECMKRSETISGHTYSLVLKAMANSRGFDVALNMFEELEREGDLKNNFDVVAYNTMISVSCSVNNWVQTLRIWRSMKDNGLIGTSITYRMLVCTFVRCGQHELAIDAYLEMLQNGLNPGDDAMQAAIGACNKEGKWELALNVFRTMLNKGLKPNLITCNVLINSLGKHGKVKQAFSIYNLMKSIGHAPDAYTWNALLGALYRANRHAEALQLFESIKKEQNSLLNLHMYNTCLMSCQSLGLWDKALQLLWQMEISGITVSATSYNLVIGACEAAREPEIALQVYEHMVHQKCTPDTFTLMSLLRCCIWGSLWHEVEEILNVS
ncbi:hypothetical protein NMG60_11013214 [Bertholletia excelsa]